MMALRAAGPAFPFHAWLGDARWGKDPMGAQRVREQPSAMNAQTGFALLLTLISACAINWGYLTEHRAASALPSLSPRRPLASLRALLGSRLWLAGFASETGGFLLYVIAVALAPLALV